MSNYDVCDQNDNPTGRIASYNEVHTKGLWHRGVHAIIYTPEGDILMQKRSLSLSFHPGEIEVSVGGGVDAGEQPESAIIREIHEEVGIALQPKDLKYLGKQAYNHRTKNEIKRVHIYNYSVCVNLSHVKIKNDPHEVESIFFIKKSQLKKALLMHRIKNMGKISGQYAYWKKLINSI